MQGIILTGGQGSRLAPLTDDKNKHLIDICGRPMVSYSLSLLLSAEVTDVTLVTNPEHVDDFKKELAVGLGTQFDPLRIVPQELWNKVAARLNNPNAKASHPGRRGKYLLTGILKCAECGGLRSWPGSNNIKFRQVCRCAALFSWHQRKAIFVCRHLCSA